MQARGSRSRTCCCKGGMPEAAKALNRSFGSSSSGISASAFRSAYAFRGSIWEEGYPRDDILLTGAAYWGALAESWLKPS